MSAHVDAVAPASFVPAGETAGPPPAVCTDPDCPLAGVPQPIGCFRENPQAKTGRLAVCSRCIERKRLASLARRRDRRGLEPAPAVSERRERARALVDAGLSYPEISERLERDEVDLVGFVLGELAVLASGRPDGRTDLPPIFSPRSQRERASEAIARVYELAPERRPGAPERVRAGSRAR